MPRSASVAGGRPSICPGWHLASASMLAVFNITKSPAEDGTPTEPSQEYREGLAAHTMPLPFKGSIKPRSEDAAILEARL
ncbi:hypothetical protein C8R46DRAFT_1215266 [Mycena filopes]|nr:hypothetical protein C8R46DRAFT_1215266 [Mycena filopes]